MEGYTPDDVIGPNPSGHIVALRSNQPRTETSYRNVPVGIYGDLTAICELSV
jgi:hypothetical protein